MCDDGTVGDDDNGEVKKVTEDDKLGEEVEELSVLSHAGGGAQECYHELMTMLNAKTLG